MKPQSRDYMMTITSLDELERLLKLLGESDVKVFKLGEMQIVMGSAFVEEEDDDDMDEREPTSSMGFETTNYSAIGVATEFDE